MSVGASSPISIIARVITDTTIMLIATRRRDQNCSLPLCTFQIVNLKSCLSGDSRFNKCVLRDFVLPDSSGLLLLLVH